MQVVMALDQGTTSSRAILFDQSGRVIDRAQQEFSQFFPHGGWVEHDAEEIWDSQSAVARQVLENQSLTAESVVAIGITNQRETVVVWNRKTGKPIHRAIVWQDRRTANFCDQLRQEGLTEMVTERTGLIIDAYFSGTKLHWILENVDGARELAEQGDLAFGTIDSWLLWNLTGGRLHLTDITNASRTMLMNLQTGDWDEEMLAILGIPRAMMPEIQATSHLYGRTSKAFLGTPIPVGGMAGDQQAALFGQNCLQRGMAKNTYGTGCFMLMNLGESAIRSSQKLLTSVAWQVDDNTTFALEGGVFIAGAVIQWLRDGLGIIQSSDEVEHLARQVPDTGGVYLVPAFAGLGAPHWDAYARGTIVGLTRGTNRAHLARAALEGIAFQVADVLTAMQTDAQIRIGELRVDGGACVNDLLMQFQADILQMPVVRPRVIETTALGAAYFAGLSTGFWGSLDEISAIWQPDCVFEPQRGADEAEERRHRWSQALDRSRAWEERDPTATVSHAE